jgi:3-methyladenine DNA glycosylase AlkD
MTRAASGRDGSIGRQAEDAVAWLKRRGTKRTRDGMARYGLPSANAFGVPVGTIQQLGRKLGKKHELALQLWDTGWYEARLLATFVGEPERMTPAEVDHWCDGFDNWGVCDTACFHLFDRTPHAWRKVSQWSRRRDEFGRRAAFALLACLALHDKRTPDAAFERSLALIERAAADERNFVKKGVSWALRLIGRRSPVLHAAALATSRRLVSSPSTAAQWIGNDARRDLMKPAVTRRLDAQRHASGRRPNA